MNGITNSSSMNNSSDLAFDSFTNYVNITSTIVTTPPVNAKALLNTYLMAYPEYRLATSINAYGYITEVVVGGVANILALIVMLKLKHLPICNYMAALALADLSVLLGPCLLRWLMTVDIDPHPTNTAVCRLFTFLTHWSFSFSSWILVAMTIDRYIAICFPLKAIRFSTSRRTRAVIAFLMFAMAIVNFHFLVIMVVDKQPGKQDSMCVGYDRFRHFLDFVWPWIDATVHSFLPFILLIVFNFLIIRSHSKSIMVTSSLKGIQLGQTPKSVNRAYRRITVTLLVVSFTFIVMTAPRLILQIIRPTVFNFKPAPNKTDFKILAQYTMTASLVNILLYGNHCINFFLYILTGHKFREQLFNMFKCQGKHRLRRVQGAHAECSGTETNTSSLRYNMSFTKDNTPDVGNVSQDDRFDSIIMT